MAAISHKATAIILVLFLSSCSSWFSNYEEFRFKKAFSQKALEITPIKKDANLIMVRSRGDELLKILTYESSGYELIGISEIKQKNRVMEFGSAIAAKNSSISFGFNGLAMRGGPRGGPGGGHPPRGHGGPPPRIGIPGGGGYGHSSRVRRSSIIIDVPLASFSSLDKKYALRLGREVGANIIINFADSKMCRKEVKSDGNISCESYDYEMNIYRMSFLRKRFFNY